MKKMSILFALLTISTIVTAKTWQIGGDLSLKEVSKAQANFELDFAAMKKATDLNEAKQTLIAAHNIEKNYPELTTGDDWAAYLDAEIALARGKWKKSSELFTAFLDQYPISRFYNAALEREYDIASAFLAGQKRRAFGIFMIRGYDDGEVMMRKVSEKAGNNSIAKRALTTLAESFESRKLYLDAYDVWTEITVRWPTGQSGQESLVGMARSMHSAYNGTNYDAAPVKSAEGYYSQYKLRYPELATEQGIDEQYKNAGEQIAYKYYSIANYYRKVGDLESASKYYNYILDSRPDTQVAKAAAEEVKIIDIEIKKDIIKIKPEDKSIMWRFWHFFNFDIVEEK